MVISFGAFVKSDVTSYEAALYSREIFYFLISFTNVFILLMVYSEIPKSPTFLVEIL